MAQRFTLRRIYSFYGSSLTGPMRAVPNILSQCTHTHGLLPTTSAKSVLTTVRKIHVSHTCGVTFNVQNKDDFQDRVVGSETPMIVDFHAQWCGPCKILGPRLEKMVAKQQGKVQMAKVDIDEHTDLALEYQDNFMVHLVEDTTRGDALLDLIISDNTGLVGNVNVGENLGDGDHPINIINVCAVPTVLAMKNGTVIDHFVGIKNEGELEAFLKKLIGP